ncbi:hypothetical protein HELRODRAFT_177395 [Helobdella robusta]|uniref:Ig-like domain-containing protein n=1 Tax=Helobdella robusta TaxID=6412 RepID=T1FBM2_HELRO|nr:hypothetical protein HELRODRAFT_177395 [Helobdella robusta]ESN98152.1 hypothetical protein HELRODRAFT_177395 [Helobdella robusta]
MTTFAQSDPNNPDTNWFVEKSFETNIKILARYVNVALKKPAYLSSEHDKYSIASYGVDGLILKKWFFPFTKSRHTYSNWFVVDLEHKYKVKYVVLFNRNGCDVIYRTHCDEKMENFVIGLTNSFDPNVIEAIRDKYDICGQWPGKVLPHGQPMRVNCSDENKSSKYVVVQQSLDVENKLNDKTVNFAELEVYVNCQYNCLTSTGKVHTIELKVIDYTSSTPAQIILAHEKEAFRHDFNGDECDNLFFNDMNLVENKLENRKYLKLSPVKKEDAGTYKCFTSAGVLHTIELNVIGQMKISSSRKYLLVNPSICNESHENVTFTCDAEYHGPSDLKLNWMRWTRPISKRSFEQANTTSQKKLPKTVSLSKKIGLDLLTEDLNSKKLVCTLESTEDGLADYKKVEYAPDVQRVDIGSYELVKVHANKDNRDVSAYECKINSNVYCNVQKLMLKVPITTVKAVNGKKEKLKFRMEFETCYFKDRKIYPRDSDATNNQIMFVNNKTIEIPSVSWSHEGQFKCRNAAGDEEVIELIVSSEFSLNFVE